MKFFRALALTLVVCAFVGRHANAQNTALLPAPKAQFFDANGYPLAGGLVYTCVAGSSCPGTPQATYTDSTGTTQNANPVVLDAGGFANIWLAAHPYKIVVETAAGVVISTTDNVAASPAPNAVYTSASYTPLTYQYADNSVFPALIEATRGSIATPVGDETPAMFCELVGSTSAASSNADFGDPSAQPACIKAYSVATNTAAGQGGAVSNVISVEGVSQTNGGCLDPGGSPCNTNSVGGIAVAGIANLNTANAGTWGGWFTANDHGFSGGMSGIEADIFASANRTTDGQYRGIQAVDVDNSSGAQNVNNDWGFYAAGFGKGFVYSSGGLPGTAFEVVHVLSGTSAANAATTVLDFGSGQAGPFKAGLDFTNATFSDAAIKSPTIKQPQILSGITNGSGFEHFSACGSSCTVTVSPCLTGGSAGATCSNSITLPAAMADTAYQAACSGVAIASGVPLLVVVTKSTTAISITTVAATAAVAGFGEFDCMVAHN